MTVSSALALDRINEGTYEDIVSGMLAMGTSALATADYKVDFHRVTESWSGNYRYRSNAGGEFRTNIVGEIASTDAGTIIAAKGNHYAGRSAKDFRPLGDESKAKDVLVIKVPTMATERLEGLFLNQVASLNAIRENDEEEETAQGVDVTVREWVRNAAGDESSPKDHIILHMLPKYGNPNKTSAFHKRVTKRTISDFSDDGTKDVNGSGVGEVDDETPAITVPVVASNAYYDPHLNKDFGGPYFNLVHNKLVQLDVRDQNGKLVAPWTFNDSLKPGTVVLVDCSLHCFIVKERTLRKIYQINVHSLKILDDSDGKPIAVLRPLPPGASEEATSNIARDISTAKEAFTNFSIRKRLKTTVASSVRALEDVDKIGISEKGGNAAVIAVTKKLGAKRRDITKGKRKEVEGSTTAGGSVAMDLDA